MRRTRSLSTLSGGCARWSNLSTISLAVDAVWSNKGGQYIPPTHTFGYFAIYRGTEEQAAPTALTSVLADDIAADEEIPAQEVLRESAISEVIFDKLKSYLRTFPSQGDGLHIVFGQSARPSTLSSRGSTG